MTNDAYNPAEEKLVAAVAYELGPTALEEAWANYGADAIHFDEDGNAWLHIRPGRWASVDDERGVVLIDHRGDVRRAVVVHDRAIVVADAVPLTAPANN